VALDSGTRLGPYEITALIGAGGMGEVYRARDTKLNRDVALKILPDAFVLDGDRIARFRREAQVLASLNHPNIAAIYGFEDRGSTHALVLELVEGPTLADRIVKGPIPLDEALPIAKQIAEALEAAHEQGIIHRDLKPANIKLRDDGTVKVLDFGLAKAMEPLSAISPALTASPTITTPAQMTGVGMILGTAAYMSPEQAKGRPADKRSDVWALGCVLYEMLTGKRAFEGEDVSDTLAAVLRADPGWNAVPSATPANIRTLLRRCLEKDVRRRIGSVGTVQFLLTEPAATDAVVPPANRWRERAVWAVALLALAAGLVFLAARKQGDRVLPLVVQFQVEAPPGEFLPGANGAPRFAVSPDGQFIVFGSTLLGKRDQLWVRRLDAPAAQPLRGTETVPVRGIAIQQPFWSSDSRYVAYFDEPASSLKRVDVSTGAVQVVTQVSGNQYAGTWNSGDVILFASSATNGLRRVSASGGTPTQLTTLDRSRQETRHLWPVFLPDGRHFVYHVQASGGTPSAIYLGELDSPQHTKLVESDYGPQFAAPDLLLYIRGQSLMAQRVDLSAGLLTGTPVLVADAVIATNAGRIAVSASNTGVLVFASGPSEGAKQQLIWVDRTGQMQTPLGPPVGSFSIALSPDGRRVALADVATGAAYPDIFVYDIDRDVRTRLTTDPAPDAYPVWSPDGTRIVFRSTRNQKIALYEVLASGSVPEHELLTTDAEESLVPFDWSLDSRLIVFGRGRDLWVLPMTGDRKPVPYLITRFNKIHAALSPNGRWLAYASNEAGSYQIFVQSFPDPSLGKWTVSPAGGVLPRWNRNGRELFYLDTAGRIMTVPVTTEGSFKLGQPVSLFTMASLGTSSVSDRGSPYDVASDGKRFLLSIPQAAPISPPLNVVVNWATRLLAKGSR